ncbi:hypothetical protein AB0N17_46735, partial [Streptomyces sp. NPDC051133]|uniref:hypothetical protein n=1 Tax=Streptomyces sp. NPDC051133 TaxID=3155521 RepID=UPI00343D8542
PVATDGYDASAAPVSPAAEYGLATRQLQSVTFPPPNNTGSAVITSESVSTVGFDISGKYSARAAIVFGGGATANAYVYDTLTFPHGLAHDTGLQTTGGLEDAVTSVLLCVTADPYNGS